MTWLRSLTAYSARHAGALIFELERVRSEGMESKKNEKQKGARAWARGRGPYLHALLAVAGFRFFCFYLARTVLRMNYKCSMC